VPSIPKHLRAAERLAKKEGWTIITNGSGHLTWISPNGTKVHVSKSPGGNRAHQNIVMKLRRAGLNIRKT
jgi:hypothetical protein